MKVFSSDSLGNEYMIKAVAGNVDMVKRLAED